MKIFASKYFKLSVVIFIPVLLLIGYFLLLEKEHEPFFIRSKPLILIPASDSIVKGVVVASSSPFGGEAGSLGDKELPELAGPVIAISEKELGIPIMRSGKVVEGSVRRIGSRVYFSIHVPLPLSTVVSFYEQRLRRKATLSQGTRGEQFTLSYAFGGHIKKGRFTYADKKAKKGSRTRTNLNFQVGRYPIWTLIEVAHLTY